MRRSKHLLSPSPRSSEEPRKCPICVGEGVMPAGAELPEYIMDEVCPLCGGDGEIWDKESKDSDEPFARYLDA